MSAIIVIEIIAAIFVLAAVVRYAVRDTQRRNLTEQQHHSAASDTSEVVANASEAPAGTESLT